MLRSFGAGFDVIFQWIHIAAALINSVLTFKRSADVPGEEFWKHVDEIDAILTDESMQQCLTG